MVVSARIPYATGGSPAQNFAGNSLEPRSTPGERVPRGRFPISGVFGSES